MLDQLLKRLISGDETGEPGGGFRVELDRTHQILRLECQEESAFGDGLAATLADGFSIRPSFVSASMLAQKAKQFDDGLYAAVELAAQEGAGSFRGKKWLLNTLLERLRDLPPGPDAGVLFGAAQLGNTGTSTPARLWVQTKQATRTFLGDELRSKPISFYTWSDDLRRVFQQDRLLQSELTDEEVVGRVAKALEEAEGAAAVTTSILG